MSNLNLEIKKRLIERSNQKCELCQSSTELSVYFPLPIIKNEASYAVYVCKNCLEQIEGKKPREVNHWRFLSESIWSDVPAILAISYRQLKLMPNEAWAINLLEQLFLTEEIEKWAMEGFAPNEKHESAKQTKDSNGNILKDGDSVTLIKDLEVKGANFTAKRGTLVKNISLTANPEHIEGRVNGTQIVLLTMYLKKVI